MAPTMDHPVKATRRTLAGLATALLLAPVGCVQREGAADPSKLLATAESFERHRLYHLGSSFEGLPLTAAPDARGGPASGSQGVDFIYGTCDPGGGPFDEGGCAPPLSVQTWSACERYIALLADPYRRTKVRSVPAAYIDGDTRLELQTGELTVVIFARTLDQARRAAKALRSLDGRIAPAEELPPPVTGALSGRPAGWRRVAGGERSGPIHCVRTRQGVSEP